MTDEANPGNADVIRVLTHWLEIAKTGKFCAFAILLVDPNMIAAEVGGDGSEFALNFGLDNLKAQVHARFHATHQPITTGTRIIPPGSH